MAPPRTALSWAIFSLVALLCGISQANPSVPMEYCARVNTGMDFDPLVSNFQSMGRCLGNCTDAEYAFAIVLEKKCWCSNLIPNRADQAQISDCNYPCPGYPDDICGGKGVWGYMEVAEHKPSGTAPAGMGIATSQKPSTTPSANVPVPVPVTTMITEAEIVQSTFHITVTITPSISSTSESSTFSSPPDQAVTSGPDSVETVTVGGVVKTVTAAFPQATGATDSSSNNGLQAGAVAGIAVGIIGGLSVLGLFVWLLWKKRRQEEQQGFVSPMRGGSASGTAKSPQVTEQPLTWEAKRRSQLMPVDPRLDPFYVRDQNRSRDSINSLQDNQDYSRRLDAPRVLRATNPDPDY
ncbi:hypothetical protein B0T21DRAFT_72344 [Apiosordaria backusii]|uniref:WSC domain-containing protein n=1 Tax=Apiosordaria backusii TaxID=314023 RepID=A0AA40AAH9_9PEZI|nr:hypothetical protein B0T21DRAFT_72344 [Apiosordaria backusii]